MTASAGGSAPPSWSRVKELLHQALERTTDERAAFLDAACAGDAALHAEVRSLLAAHDDAAFLEVPAFAHAADALASSRSMLGQHVGPFLVVRELGRGGMGTVYLAERADGTYERRVALKVINRGMDTELVVRRFRRERQILAALDHPNVARLYTGGTTDDGRPYFAMEYVEGEPIDAYCARRALGIPERLALFRRVCEAVHYAHQRLVVHRDLKPGNILVTADGTPKLLDFGIARVLGAGEARATPSRTTLHALTPEYASPEQLTGEPETTLSDVYALGVLLYELLVGRHPFPVAGRTPTEIVSLLVSAEAPRPSIAAPDVARRLRGDLDNIVMKAMRREPARRYASAEQLADDLRRHLEHLPVLARPETPAYVVARFVRRHRATVAAAGLALGALVGGAAAIAYQAHVARVARLSADRRFDDVRTLATSFLFELDRAIAPLPGSTDAREMIVHRSLASLDRLAREAHGDASLLRDLAAAYVSVGDVQGAPYTANLGHTADAVTSYRKAVAILERLTAEAPDDLDAGRALVHAYSAASAVQARAGDVDGAIATQRRAVTVAGSLVERAPRDRANQRLLAEGLLFLGRAVFQKSSIESSREALAAYDRSHALWTALAASDPADAKAHRSAWVSGVYRAYPLWRIGELAHDTSALRSALRELASYHAAAVAEAAAHPNDTKLRRDAGDGLHEMAHLHRFLGETDTALALLHDARPMMAALAAADPRNAEAQRDLAIVDAELSAAYAQARRWDAAIAAGSRARATLTRLVTRDGTSNDDLENLGVVSRTMADVELARGRPAAALGYYREAAAYDRRWASMAPTSAGPARALAGDEAGITRAGGSSTR